MLPIQPTSRNTIAWFPLFDRMLTLVPKRRAESNPQVAAKLAATDRQIDRLVYDFYGLTEEEIVLIEGS
jgi:hypothetical protein